MDGDVAAEVVLPGRQIRSPAAVTTATASEQRHRCDYHKSEPAHREATVMPTEKKSTENPPIVGAPAVQQVDDDPKAGPGEVVVTSPTGAKSVVDESAVDALKTQGYKIG